MIQAGSALACIVLAAGSSKRFGSDKRQATLDDGRTLLEATLAGIPRLFEKHMLVLHPGDEALAKAHDASWNIIIAPDAALGMGHSLAAALRSCADCMAVLVVLADMPAVQQSTYAALIAELRAERIVLPRYQGKRGNPVGIGADFFADLQQPSGDQGARRLLQTYPDAVLWLDCEDAGVLKDVDTFADLESRGAGSRAY